jgi:5'-3' exonuclease
MATTIANLGAPAPIGNLLIVDGLNVAFRWKHQNILDFKYDYIRTIESLAKSYNAGTIIVCADGGSSYRKEIYPEYKANRKERYAEQTEQEAKEFEMFMAEFADTLTLIKEKYPVFHFRGVEADDIAAYITKNFDFDDCWLISSDKDWDLLINDKVSRFSTVTRKKQQYIIGTNTMILIEMIISLSSVSLAIKGTTFQEYLELVQSAQYN